MQNPFAHAHFRDRSRPFMVMVGVLFGLMLVGGFAAKPIWRVFRDHRVMKFVQQAQAAMATNDLTVATANLQAGFKLNPRLPALLRVAGIHYSRLGMAYGLPVWEQLEASGQMTSEDRFEWARLALNCRQPRTAMKALAPFAATNSTDPDALALLSEVYLTTGRYDQARGAAYDAWRTGNGRPDLLLNLARIESRHPETEVSAEGVSKLMSLLVGNHPTAGAAAIQLLSLRDHQAVSQLLVNRLVNGHLVSNAEMNLARLVVRLRSGNTDPEEAVREYLGPGKEFWLQPRFPLLVQSLLALGEFQPLANLIGEDTAVCSEDLAAVRLEALWRLGRWDDVSRLLDRPAAKISSPLESIYRAMVAGAEGRKGELRQLWAAAIVANRHTPDFLEIVANRSESADCLMEAVRAWRETMVFPEAAERAAKEIVRLAPLTGDWEAALAAYGKLLQMYPSRSDLRIHVALLQLLLRVNEAEAKATLAGLSEAERGSDLAKVALALNALRDLQPDRALDFVNQVHGNWDQVPRPWPSVRAAALEKTGQRALAKQEMGKKNAANRWSAAELKLVEESAL